MIRRFVIALAAVFLFALPLAAYADVVFGNDFLDKHRDKTEPVGRSFIVDGPDGYVSVKVKPGSEKEEIRIDNGAIVHIVAVYKHKGAYWGITPSNHAYYYCGWFPMDELLVYYDSADFAFEHSGEFYEYTGDFDKVLAAEGFYIWQWPGADREKINYINEYLEPGALKTEYAWMDGEGNEWIYLLIWGGYSTHGGYSDAAEGWVCINDPQNGNIPAFNPAPEPSPWSPPDGSGTTGPGSSGSEPPLPLLIIIIAAALAVVLILVLRRKKAKA
ncbi:MAG: hypothetical protein FWG03_03915 [Clostridiales bacterium]|nr:hypothetical protein [Clostridiales bacterium]